MPPVSDAMPTRTGRAQRGFNLVSLMLIVAVIGVVAATNLCACFGGTDYALRAKCAEAIAACAEWKTQVVAFAIKSGRLPADKSELERVPAAPRIKHVRSIELLSDASIVTHLQGGKEFEGRWILMRPSLEGDKVIWACSTTDASLHKYVPAECRH
jgi:type IV pilus assembly protein PilA